MNGEEKLIEEHLDRAIYDSMTTIWKAYRESVIAGNYKQFNACFRVLYDKYPDEAVEHFIQGMGLGLVSAMNRRLKDD